MRHKHFGAAVLSLIIGALVACGDDPLEPAVPYTFSIMSGADQVGSAGWPLDSLAVGLADARGDAVDDVQVVWLVTSGEGLFRLLVGGQETFVSSIATQTGSQGEGSTAVRFVPLEVGTSTVTAYATFASGFPIGSVEFTAEVETLSIRLDRDVDWSTVWPEGPQGAVIELGTGVAWRPTDTCCNQRVRSLSVPAGGTSFDASLSDDSTFVFEPDAPGTWTWVWDHDEENWETWWPETVSDTATLVVQ